MCVVVVAAAAVTKYLRRNREDAREDGVILVCGLRVQPIIARKL